MAIEAPYPSRNQSRWDNPLFVRHLLRRASQTVIVAMVLAVSAVGAWAVTDYDSAQPRDATYGQPGYSAPIRPQNRTPVARRAAVRIASRDLHTFSPEDNSSL
jgi:hypothetical protein